MNGSSILWPDGVAENTETSDLPGVPELTHQNFSVNCRVLPPIQNYCCQPEWWIALGCGGHLVTQSHAYLLASSLTLSISAISETSLSMMLGRNRNKRGQKLRNLTRQWEHTKKDCHSAKLPQIFCVTLPGGHPVSKTSPWKRCHQGQHGDICWLNHCQHIWKETTFPTYRTAWLCIEFWVYFPLNTLRSFQTIISIENLALRQSRTVPKWFWVLISEILA